MHKILAATIGALTAGLLLGGVGTSYASATDADCLRALDLADKTLEADTKALSAATADPRDLTANARFALTVEAGAIYANKYRTARDACRD